MFSCRISRSSFERNSVPEYKASWERKLKFYEEIGYTLGENLFTTCDHENGAIMTEEVEDVIRKIKEQL